jgi:arylsulfatase A-like enzyme
MIARWPGTIPSGRTSDQVWAFWDVMPTLAEIAGLPIPQEIDGISMLPALLGERQEKQHEYLYWDYGHQRQIYLQAVRWGDWKGLRIGADAPIELYDVINDPGERDNAAAQHPDVVAQIETYMRDAYTPSEDYRLGEIYVRES